MAGERRDANTMSVELAIQRELAYRKMVAGSLSQQEINNLLPLKAPDSSINCDRESELEKDGWKLVRIDEEGEGIPFRSSNSGQASMQALERTQPKMQAEKGKSVPSANAYRRPLPVPALEGPKLKMQAQNGKSVPSSSAYGNPNPKPTHEFSRQSVMSQSKPGCGTRPFTTTNRPIPTANGMPVSTPNPKPSPSVPAESQRTSHPGINFHTAGETSTGSLNCLPKPTSLYPNTVRNGPDLFCHLCKVDCSSPFNYKQHLKGHKHRANLRFKPRWTAENSANTEAGRNKRKFCELCSVWCSDETLLELHFKGRKHQEKLRGGGQQQNAAQQQQRWCGLCKVPCINQLSYEQHLKGKNHAFHLRCLRTSSGQDNTNA